MIIDAVVDSSDLDRWLIEKAAVMGVGLGEVLMDEGSFLLETVTRITPPTDGTLSPTQSWAQGRRMGRNALIGDLHKVYVTSASVAGQIREQDADAAKGFSKAVRKGDVGEAQRIMYAYGLRGNASGNMGLFDASEHRRRKDRRGRVRRGSPSLMVTNAPAFNQYKRDELRKVGQLKRGWVVAGHGLKRKIRVPAWILRAEGGGSGSMRNQTRRAVNPSISFYNTSSHADSSNRVLRFGNKALMIRASKVRRSVQHMVKRRWRR